MNKNDYSFLKRNKYFYKGDKSVCDTQRVDIVGRRLFSEKYGLGVKNDTQMTYEDAKLLAVVFLYDLEYRQQRSKQADRT